MAGLPSATDFFGDAQQPAAAPGALPSASDFFADAPTEQHTSGPGLDSFLSQHAAGRVLDAFGQGAKQAWGAEPVGYAGETTDFLKKAGAWGDHIAQRNDLLKAFNVSVVRPAVLGSSLVTGSVANVFRGVGAVLGGTEQAVAATGAEAERTAPGRFVGAKKLGETLAGGVEFAGQTGIPELAGGIHGEPAPAAVDIPKARSLGVIGEGEEGYFGTAQPKPENIAERTEGVKQQIAAQPPEPEPTVAAEPGEVAPAPAPAPPETPAQAPDIHAVARQIAPDTFQAYDNLSARHDTFNRWISELRDQRDNDPKVQAAQGEIETILGKVNGVEDRLTKRASDQLEDIRGGLQDYLATDTPDMVQVKKALAENYTKMSELAPQVRDAYRAAREQHPELAETAEAPAPTAATEPAPPEQIVQAGEALSAEAEKPPNPEAVATETKAPEAQPAAAATEPSPQIASDVSKKLTNAGRPKEEADAAAALVASHYEARAERFGGKKGSAYELYAREAPNIRAGGRAVARDKELAQTGKTLEQSKRGSITLSAARNTIKLFKDSNASTFIHETGHDWLEELMRDAKDEQAPDDLKTDAQTVRDYIGAKEGEAIPTRAHEKFARGFERYMMEGVAPSKQLAGVFAKFKDWLTQIYRTVQKLRSPITEDIRSVFDRLVTKNPERTTIAEDHTVSEMAEQHEKLAADTPPEKAAEVAGQVRSDIDKIAKEKAPPVYDELNPNGPGREPAENAGAAGGGNEAGPDTGANGAAQEPGDIAAGGNEVAAEGAEVPGDTTAGSGNADRGPTPEPTGANQHFTDGESHLVDKAGNIRLDNLNTPEDVSQVIRETANDNGGYMSARRGVLTDGEVLDLADALGVNPAFLDGRKLGQAFNAEQIVAARKLLIRSATNVRDLMRKASGGTDADVMAYAEAKARHIMVQEQVAGITAEAGRALRAFRKMEGSDEAKVVGDFLKDATGRTLNQLREEAKLGAKLETPFQVSKYMDDLNKHPLKNAILEYYINALISGPITHFRYSVGNALNALWTPLVQIPTAAAIGVGREALGLGAEANRVYMGEAGAQLFAMVKGSRDGWKAATEAFSSGLSPSLPGERLHMQNPGAIPGTAGKVIRLPSKSVSAIHSFFKSLRYEQNIQGLAYRTAMNEGLSGDAFANRISDLTMRPTPDMIDEAGHLIPDKMDAKHFENVEGATQNALKELYMAPTKYDSAMGALNRAIDRSLTAKLIVPFMKIGSQITRNAFIEQTPLGFTSPEIRAEFAKGGAAADFQAAKMTAGVALAGITVGLAAEGLATGDGPEDPHQRALWMLNHRPNSVTIGDISIPYQGLGSLGMLMRFSANSYEVGSQIGHESSGKLAIAFLEGMTKSVLDDNFMRGMKDALDAIYHPEEYGWNYIKGFATNWLPFSVGLSQVAREVDPSQREAQTIWDEAKRKIPFVSESLPVRRDMFGEPIPNSGPLPDYATDPVVQAMESLKVAPGKLTRKIRGIALTDDQYDQYSMEAGRMAKLQLNQAVSLPGFDQFPASVRIDLIHKAISTSREIARSKMMAQNPTIMQRAIQAKLDPLHEQQSDFNDNAPAVSAAAVQ